MNHVKRLAVYCGSAPGSDPAFAEAARALTREMAARGVDLVYGGGRLGLMGIIADTMLEAGGRVYGVIPQALVDHEVAHLGCTELHTVANMHERKAKMTELCDAFIALPGGIGTLDETFESLTWRQLGLHDKPIFLVDIAGYWRLLAELLDHIVARGFAAPLVPRLIEIVPDVAALMAALAQAAPGRETRSDLL